MPAGWTTTQLINTEDAIILEAETHSLQTDRDDTNDTINSTTSSSSTTPLVVLSEEDTATSDSLESPDDVKANTTAVPSIEREFSDKVGRKAKLEQAGAECMISRGGWCKTHDIQTRKVINKTRKWDKLKTGLFGFKYSSKTSWLCTWKPDYPYQKSDSEHPVATKGGKEVGVLTMGCDARSLEGANTGTKRWRENGTIL